LPIDRWATFDCYGTLIDWEGGIAGTLSSLWPDSDRGQLLRRYHEVEPRIQAGSALPYREVLAATLRTLAGEEGLQVPAGDENALADSLPNWSAFPDVPPSLRELRLRGWKLGILSNTDPDLLAASVRHIGVEPDLMITASEAGSYKPAHGHWRRFREMSGAGADGHVHVAASPFHDLAPAAELGIPAVWINRLRETSDLLRAAELPDLTRLPDILDGLVNP
jgi:2-haloacid dehalogenase